MCDALSSCLSIVLIELDEERLKPMLEASKGFKLLCMILNLERNIFEERNHEIYI